MNKIALILVGLMIVSYGCSSDEAKDAAQKTKEAISATKLAASKAATLDRLTHRCHILECNGQSYRLADAKRRRQRK